MKYFVVFVALIPFFVISLNPLFAMCANDLVNPNTPCDDLIEMLILDSPQTQIENINGMWYYVSEPLMSNLSVDKIVLHDVSFTLPYRNDPPRYTYSDVVFSDGTKETLSVLFDEPAFTEHVSPQAGFIGKTNGYSFLVSVDLKELSPLKQFKSGIPNYKIQCKEGLKLLIRSSEGPSACVKGDTATELQTRWHKPNDILLEHYKDKPEVKAFYAKYDDVIVSVQDDHVSYVAGNEVDFRVRMNLYFDKNHEIDHITLNCYVQKQHQTDVPEGFILKYLKEYDCKKYD